MDLIIKGAKEGTLPFLEFDMRQNAHAIPAFSQLFRKVRPNRIIEIGTFSGGLTCFLGLYGKLFNIPVISYDITDYRNEVTKQWFDTFNIEYRLIDAFQDPQLIQDIRQDGVTLLLCDGGNKPAEMNHFSQFLKSGDIIMAHDYCSDIETFNRDFNGKIWSWCEISDEVINVTNCDDFMKEVFTSAVWICKKKR